MKDNTKKTLKYYWQDIRNYKGSGLLIVFGVIGANILNAVIPLFFKNFFNLLSSNQSKEIIVVFLLKILLIIGILEISRWFCY